MQRGQTPMFAREIIYTPYFYLQKRNHVGSSNGFSSKTRSPWLAGWPSTRIRSCCVLSAFIINKSKTMERKGYKRFATTEAEIEEKR
jgi:hypothetical protein